MDMGGAKEAQIVAVEERFRRIFCGGRCVLGYDDILKYMGGIYG